MYIIQKSASVQYIEVPVCSTYAKYFFTSSFPSTTDIVIAILTYVFLIYRGNVMSYGPEEVHAAGPYARSLIPGGQQRHGQNLDRGM